MDKPIWWRGSARNDNHGAPGHGSGGARVIVVGNEKGGAGKSTLAALIATSMLYRGSRVAVIDADLRQQSLSRFLANRRSGEADRGAGGERGGGKQAQAAKRQRGHRWVLPGGNARCIFAVHLLINVVQHSNQAPI